MLMVDSLFYHSNWISFYNLSYVFVYTDKNRVKYARYECNNFCIFIFFEMKNFIYFDIFVLLSFVTKKVLNSNQRLETFEFWFRSFFSSPFFFFFFLRHRMKYTDFRENWSEKLGFLSFRTIQICAGLNKTFSKNVQVYNSKK